MSKQCKDKWARLDLLHLNSSANMAAWLCLSGCRVPMSCIIFASGAARHAEEAVLSDRPTGSARKRELPEREKQSARHASEGRSGRCVLLPRAFTPCLRRSDARRRERSWRLWMESMQSCLRGSLFPTAACPSQRWVPRSQGQFQSL